MKVQLGERKENNIKFPTSFWKEKNIKYVFYKIGRKHKNTLFSHGKKAVKKTLKTFFTQGKKKTIYTTYIYNFPFPNSQGGKKAGLSSARRPSSPALDKEKISMNEL